MTVVEQAVGDICTFMDGACVHSSDYSKKWISGKDVDVLDWPSRSPDLNVIENFWPIVSRAVYINGRKYHYIEELQD